MSSGAYVGFITGTLSEASDLVVRNALTQLEPEAASKVKIFHSGSVRYVHTHTRTRAHTHTHIYTHIHIHTIPCPCNVALRLSVRRPGKNLPEPGARLRSARSYPLRPQPTTYYTQTRVCVCVYVCVCVTRHRCVKTLVIHYNLFPAMKTPAILMTHIIVQVVV